MPRRTAPTLSLATADLYTYFDLNSDRALTIQQMLVADGVQFIRCLRTAGVKMINQLCVGIQID